MVVVVVVEGVDLKDLVVVVVVRDQGVEVVRDQGVEVVARGDQGEEEEVGDLEGNLEEEVVGVFAKATTKTTLPVTFSTIINNKNNNGFQEKGIVSS